MLPKISYVHNGGTQVNVITTYYVGTYVMFAFTSVWQTVERAVKWDGIQRVPERLKGLGKH